MLQDNTPNPFAEADDLRAENARLQREADYYHNLNMKLYAVIETLQLTVALLKERSDTGKALGSDDMAQAPAPETAPSGH